MADAVGTVAGACLGTSTVTSYVESSAGVAQGGKDRPYGRICCGVVFAGLVLFADIPGNSGVCHDAGPHLRRMADDGFCERDDL